MEANIPAPQNNNATLGFWYFFSNIYAMQNKLVHVSLSNYMIVTIYIQNSSNVDVYCTLGEHYNQTLTSKTSNIEWDNYFTDPSWTNPLSKKNRLQITYPYNSSLNTNTSWAYLRCGISNQLKSAFFYGQIESNIYEPTIPEIPMVKENVKYDQANDLNTEKLDYLLRFNYNTSNYLTLKITQASQLSYNMVSGVTVDGANKFYVKNLTIHQDYIKKDVQFQYYSLHQFITLNSDFPELIYMIGFDNLASSSVNNWSTEGWNFTTTSPTKITTVMTAASTTTYTQTARVTIKNLESTGTIYPKYFVRMEIQPNKNVKYTSSDLNSPSVNTPNMTVDPNQMLVFEDSLAYSCNANTYLSKFFYFYKNNKLLDRSTLLCAADCPTNYTILPGSSRIKGYCNFQCNYTNSQIAVCPNTGAMINSASNTFDYQFNTFDCNANYFALNYTCKANDVSGNINIDRKLFIIT